VFVQVKLKDVLDDRPEVLGSRQLARQAEGCHSCTVQITVWLARRWCEGDKRWWLFIQVLDWCLDFCGKILFRPPFLCWFSIRKSQHQFFREWAAHWEMNFHLFSM